MTFRAKPIAGAVAAALCLIGCATHDSAPPPNLEQGLSEETPNHVVVRVSRMAHIVRFEEGTIEPDAGQISELNDFLVAAGAGQGTPVLIERSRSAADDDRTAVLSGALSRKGLRPTVRAVAGPTGALRLTIERYSASAPNCPNWSKTPGNDLANTLPSDFGCATAANLAAMVGDPRDLVAGTDATPGGGDPALAPLQRYLTGHVAPLTSDGASGSAPHTSAPGS